MTFLVGCLVLYALVSCDNTGKVWLAVLQLDSSTLYIIISSENLSVSKVKVHYYNLLWKYVSLYLNQENQVPRKTGLEKLEGMAFFKNKGHREHDQMTSTASCKLTSVMMMMMMNLTSLLLCGCNIRSTVTGSWYDQKYNFDFSVRFCVWKHILLIVTANMPVIESNGNLIIKPLLLAICLKQCRDVSTVMEFYYILTSLI